MKKITTDNIEELKVGDVLIKSTTQLEMKVIGKGELIRIGFLDLDFIATKLGLPYSNFFSDGMLMEKDKLINDEWYFK